MATIPWPANFPPTSRARVEGIIAAAPASERPAFEKFMRARVTGREARNYLDAWLNVAWASLSALGGGDKEGVYQRVLADAPSWTLDDLGTAPLFMAVWLPEGSASASLAPFFRAWKQEIDGLRAQWNVRHPAKEAIRARLDAIGSASIDEDTRLEVQRMVSWAADLARASRKSIDEQRAQLGALIEQRRPDLGRSLYLTGEAIGQAIAAAVRATLNAAWNLAAGVAGGMGWGVALGLGVLALGGAWIAARRI